jgi:hypothetical protein
MRIETLMTSDMRDINSFKNDSKKLDALLELVGDRGDTAEKLYIPLSALGLKIGGTAWFPSQEPQEVQRHFDTLGLHTRTRIAGKYDFTNVFYSKNKQLVNQAEFGERDRAFGELIGVPEEDNLWYEEDNEPRRGDATPIPEYLGLQRPISGLKYARIVPWVCRPTESGLRRAINMGREWLQVARKLDEECDYSGALVHAETLMDKERHMWYGTHESVQIVG